MSEVKVQTKTAALHEDKNPKKRRKRAEMFKYRERLSQTGLTRQLRENDPEDYKHLLRIDDCSFQKLLNLVLPHIRKRDTIMRKAIPAEDRLVATLRFLATGRSLEDLKFSTSISAQALGKIIPETCDAMIKVLKSEYMKFPRNSEEWKNMAQDFENLWNFPNCGGAIGGKHIAIQPPAYSGAFYYNYKNYFSLVLMAIANANLEFVMVDIGTNGHVSDGEAIENTLFYTKLKDKVLKLPNTSETKNQMDFVFVVDDAFDLDEHFLKPFPPEELTHDKKVFNYRLSRARAVIENAFGILANRFRVFHTAIKLKPETVESVVMACCVLHNFLRRNCASTYSPECLMDREDIKTGEVTNADWRAAEPNKAFDNLELGYQCDSNANALLCRQKYVKYFNGDGMVPWQDHMVLKRYENAYLNMF